MELMNLLRQCREKTWRRKLAVERAARNRRMEKAREVLTLRKDESESVSRLAIPPHRVGRTPSFFEGFFLRGILVDRVEPGFLSCTFKVPPRLTDTSGNLAPGFIASLVDVIGGSADITGGEPMKVTLDVSISFLSNAKANDEVEITATVLGKKGGYSRISVVLRNKETGELIAESRLSLLGPTQATAPTKPLEDDEDATYGRCLCPKLDKFHHFKTFGTLF